jgi:hypothetical protein
MNRINPMPLLPLPRLQMRSRWKQIDACSQAVKQNPGDSPSRPYITMIFSED